MNKQPLITIGITCFNAEKTLERALLGALNQDWPNFEIIVVDDASTDSSKVILKKYEHKIKNISVYYQTVNKGCANSRNIVISKAKGKFIAFFDDDDFSRSERIRLQYNYLINYEKKESAELVACFASGYRIYPNGYKKKINAVGSFGIPPIGLKMANYLLFNERINKIDYGAGVPTCSLLARTSIFKRIGGFDSHIKRQEDVDLAIRLAMNNGHFIGIREPVINQYVSISDDKSVIVEYESSLAILDKYIDYLTSRGIYKYMKMWMKLKYFHLSHKNFKALIVLIRIFVSYPLRTIKHFSRSSINRFLHEQLINSNPKRLILKKYCVKFLNHNMNIFNHE